ncbi:putative glucose-6-phosphate 1-epimerase [Cardamine amara subsp. amara]|uniref:glucose-6-phosphate 1-epimerase n=1 Tax=Cardamine amara subsp. amara TaxID=228776 RepID=A0ABD1A7W4_CARAN
MGNKKNLGSVIFFWTLLVAVVAIATEHRPIEKTKGINGLDKLIIRDRHGRSVEVYLYGAQVTSWKNEKQEELLVMSSKAIFNPPTAIRGGIPVLFPQYSNTGPLPSHGFARNRFWEIETNPPPLITNCSSHAFVDLILRSSDDDLKIWPHKFVYRLRVTIGVKGDLTLTSRVKNSDTKPFNFTFGLHPYFAVSDISEIQVDGLSNLDYLDQQKNRTRFTDHEKTITFTSQLDRLYLNTPDTIRIVDHKKKKTIVVHKEGQVDAVVWNPWDKKVSDLGVEDYRRFVAVESAAVAKPITVNPGEEWKGLFQAYVVPSSCFNGKHDSKKSCIDHPHILKT